MDINDLAFRFYESPIEELFSEIQSSTFPQIGACESIAERLKGYLNDAARFCTYEWDSNHPVLYRARKNDYGQFSPFASKDMGPPEAHISSAGRAQPAGRSVFYIADTAQTAIAEVKPEVDEYVTIGTFSIKPKESLKVLDLTRFKQEVILLPKELTSLINLSRRAFSAPVHPKNPTKYYAHQYFVQEVRDFEHDRKKYDGIGYTSAVHHGGRCFAFFGDDKFLCTETSLHQVKSVSITSEPVNYSLAEREYVDQLDATRQ